MFLNAHCHTLPTSAQYVFLNGTTGVFDHPQASTLFPFYGVHPWSVDAVAHDWLAQLVARVQATACGIGEIGLDKAKGHISLDKQKTFFELQLKLAQKYDRPVAIHAVRAWPEVLAALDKTPVRAMLHQFQASADRARQLLARGCFLSIATGAALEDLLTYIPLERLFLEDESADTSRLEGLYVAVARIKQVTVAELSRQMLINAQVFTGQSWQETVSATL